MVERPPVVPMPPYVFVPGQNARHPEDWFDEIKASVQPGMNHQTLQDSRAFRAGLAYLDAGYFWECHEVLEAVWMVLAPKTQERLLVQALIQLANAELKLLMKRPNAVGRLCDIVTTQLDALPSDVAILGVQSKALRNRVKALQLRSQ
ncbi:MAG: DUF309 domain-containing protein [Sulfitobacter sp.]